jgi:hypothetical protein
MTGWPFVAFLSDDGEYLVTAYAWGDLLERTYRPDEVMLTFYKRGQLIRSIRLNQLLRDTRHVYRTASHYFWGHLDGFSDLHWFAVDTVEQRRFVFDVTTGAVVREARPSPSSPAREPPGIRWERSLDEPGRAP